MGHQPQPLSGGRGRGAREPAGLHVHVESRISPDRSWGAYLRSAHRRELELRLLGNGACRLQLVWVRHVVRSPVLHVSARELLADRNRVRVSAIAHGQPAVRSGKHKLLARPEQVPGFLRPGAGELERSDLPHSRGALRRQLDVRHRRAFAEVPERLGRVGHI